MTTISINEFVGDRVVMRLEADVKMPTNQDEAVRLVSDLSRFFEDQQAILPVLYEARTRAIHYLFEECGLSTREIHEQTDMTLNRVRALVKDRRLDVRAAKGLHAV